MSVEIIRCEEKYIPSFRSCLDRVAKEQKYLLLLEAPPLEQVQEFVKQNIADNVPQCFAIEGEEVIGWCDIKPFERETINHVADLGMGLLPEYRGKGIGSRLVRETIAWARERGIERVELEVFSSNNPAIKLYKKEGFEQEGIKRKARKLNGQYDDMVVMAKLI